MKRKSKITYIHIATALVCAFVLFLLFTFGLFKKEPKVDVTANNCYSETLHVVTDEDYRPYSFYEKNGTYSGHDVELITMIANKLNMNLDLWFMPWDEAIKAVTEGRADVLMTCDYSDAFAGSEYLVKSEPVSSDDFIVYAVNRINSVDELYSKKIAIIENANVLTQLKMLNLDKNCIEYSSNRKAMKAVIDNEADCVIMRNTIGNTLLQESQYKDLTGYLSIGKSYMCFGIDEKQKTLANKINAAIEQLKTEGEIARLSDKWLTTFVQKETLLEALNSNRWIIAIIVALVFTIVFEFVKDKKRSIKNEEEKNLYIDVIEKISSDFESVMYIRNYEENPDDVIELRLSDTLKNNIPGWEKQAKLKDRLVLMGKYMVVPDDVDRFMAQTTRRSVLRKIDSGKVYFVNFEAVIDGKIHNYQLKFTPGEDEDGTKSCIVGIHNIDEENNENEVI